MKAILDDMKRTGERLDALLGTKLMWAHADLMSVSEPAESSPRPATKRQLRGVIGSAVREGVAAKNAARPFLRPEPRRGCHKTELAAKLNTAQQGVSVSALVQQFGNIHAAALALGSPSVKALQDAIRAFCRG
jgi:hypothetical protein